MRWACAVANAISPARRRPGQDWSDTEAFERLMYLDEVEPGHTADEQFFEYLNCHAKTGMLGAVDIESAD